jgi:mono/diheme cytochrome c family protein
MIHKPGITVYAAATVLAASLGSVPSRAASAQQPSAAPEKGAAEHALLNRYCVSCHNDKLKTGGLALDTVGTANVPAGADVWERVIR